MLNKTNIEAEATPQPKPLFGLSLDELASLMEAHGQRPYRAAQLAEAVYRQRAASLDDITTLPAELRESFAAEGYAIGLPEIVQTARSVDGTERYLVRMADGETVETVWMPDGDGGERGDGSVAAEEEEGEDKAGNTANFPYRRATICISSQVGCAVNCQFCLTAKLGIRRNLTPGEIAGQVAAVLNRHRLDLGSSRGNPSPARINLVFMGMGEPFLNYANFMAAVRLLVYMRIPESRMTVSTSGILPGILDFAKEAVRPKLAVSLNAPNDVIRESIMPITRKWNIAALFEALDTIPLRNREWITFEYVMLGGINDSLADAEELIALVRNMRCKINLIVWNSGPDMPYHEPTQAGVYAFQKRIMDAGIPAYIRRPRGRDIYAACGQLKRTVESDPLPAPLVEISSAATLRG
ncbi:MAG TPA: 23S rRNA (adenine(2503)-C(2))-methyltransferase RlmN [Edaphobacter sp.]|uniref:23S rRNA (adenine(2503)-C(2))-methyltransferase RlmN n=1 Tax=Edaphobacter sp. TaxID=1934404 RepID=UPI002CE6900B|nr:23S rRNA (adenine(2503)-C(2))-methyltransferase RlmN [Edaphobacter sp.]HUZ94458.1 23S rRNA (adenine(2503)-C(2))-methyltransferase RlmN [Edaphobacter sp.]